MNGVGQSNQYTSFIFLMNCFQTKQILREAGDSKPYSCNQEGRHLTWMSYLSYMTFFELHSQDSSSLLITMKTLLSAWIFCCEDLSNQEGSCIYAPEANVSSSCDMLQWLAPKINMFFGHISFSATLKQIKNQRPKLWILEWGNLKHYEED